MTWVFTGTVIGYYYVHGTYEGQPDIAGQRLASHRICTRLHQSAISLLSRLVAVSKDAIATTMDPNRACVA